MAEEIGFRLERGLGVVDPCPLVTAGFHKRALVMGRESLTKL